MLHQHGGQEDDEDVDGVVQDEDGREKLTRSLSIAGPFEQVKDRPGSFILRFRQRTAVPGSQGEEGDFTARDERADNEQQKGGGGGKPDAIPLERSAMSEGRAEVSIGWGPVRCG